MTTPSVDSLPEQKYEVTPLELFFDLVFVFAVSQLSHHLLTHLSWRGAAETLVMLAAIFAAWFSTSWSATIIRDPRSQISWLILTVMLLGLFMNAAIARAFTTSGWAFVIPMLLIQLGRAGWMVANATNAVFRDHYLRVLLWSLATAPLWLAGAAVNPEARLACWAVATGIDLMGRWLAHPIPGRRLRSENVAFDADHMMERGRLFLIIALGETVLMAGTAIAGSSLTLMTLVTGTCALAGTVALWALSFGSSSRMIKQHATETSDPILASRHAINALMVMVAGLIAVAVANEEAIAHPQERSKLALSLLMGGGPTLFLAAQGWYLWAVVKARSRLHLLGSVTLLPLCLAMQGVPSYIELTIVGASLIVLAKLERQG